MAYVSRSRWRSWHQQGGIIEDVLNELECSKTEHFRYCFGGTKSAQYKITLNGDREIRIKMSSYLNGADILPELNGWYSDSDTDEQKRMKSLRYILAKAYYRLCCELIQIPCSKQDQHNKSLGFAVGRVDVYQHLLKRKADCDKKREQREELKRMKNEYNRFNMMEIEKDDPDTGFDNERFTDMHTYRDLLAKLQLLDDEQLDMRIIHYDEESNIFWPTLEFAISKKEIVDDDIVIKENHPLFFLPR